MKNKKPVCRAAGIYAYYPDAPPVDQEELKNIRVHMASRGADSNCEWYSYDNRVGLRRRLLSIVDLSENAEQPMISVN